MDNIWSLVITSLVSPLALGLAGVMWKFLEKRLNLRINELESKFNDNNAKTKKDVGAIYNVIAALLSNLQASRVYIMQPHPLGKNEYISVIFEVTDMGVMPIKDKLIDFPAANMPCFVGDISQRDFLFYKNISLLKGERSRAFFTNTGSESLIVKRLRDDKNDWIGSIIVDCMEETQMAPDYAKNILRAAADKIQFILPPVESI